MAQTDHPQPDQQTDATGKTADCSAVPAFIRGTYRNWKSMGRCREEQRSGFHRSRAFDWLVESHNRVANRWIKAFRAAAATERRHCVGAQFSGGDRQPPQRGMGARTMISRVFTRPRNRGYKHNTTEQHCMEEL
jgi:hypothetical protein